MKWCEIYRIACTIRGIADMWREKMAKIPCSYCNTLNDPAAKTCIGCGAPLEAPVARPVVQPFQPVQQVIKPAQTSTPFGATESQKLQDGAQQIEKLYAGATSVYRTAWSVTGDAIAIAMVAFALGLIGGATGMGVWGVLGAMLVGLVIGYAEQSFWLTVVAAPVAALIGAGGWAILWAAGAGPKGMVFTTTLMVCIGALIGSRRRITSLGCSAAVRPMLGAMGGFFFALLGLVIGLAIRAL
jgi:hypothetical protein